MLRRSCRLHRFGQAAIGAGFWLASLLAASPAAAQRPTADEVLNLLDSAVRTEIVEHEIIDDWTAFRIQTFPTDGTRSIQACALSHRGPAHALDFYEVLYPMVVDGYHITGRTDRLVLQAGPSAWDYTNRWTMEMQMNLLDGTTLLDRRQVFFTPLPHFDTHFVGEMQSHYPEDVFAWLTDGSVLLPDARLVARIEGREIQIPLARLGAALSAFERMCDNVIWFNGDALR